VSIVKARRGGLPSCVAENFHVAAEDVEGVVETSTLSLSWRAVLCVPRGQSALSAPDEQISIHWRVERGRGVAGRGEFDPAAATAMFTPLADRASPLKGRAKA
jgi:hypothetical protein